MLRRIVRTLLLGLGLILLLWFPLSYVADAMIVGGGPGASRGLYAGEGALRLVLLDGKVNPTGASVPAYIATFDSNPLWPDVSHVEWDGTASGGSARVISIPLWLVAAICLAWPVTSLLLARCRRKGRGFAVEAGGGGPAPGIDPPPRHPDNLPPP